MSEPMRVNETYTYADLLTWQDETRWELIDGTAYAMSPAPARLHQVIVGTLFARFFNYLEDKPCEVYISPFDVRLPHPGESAMTTATVVQPDITVVCEPEKLDEHGCIGAPTLVIEVMSPESSTRDLREKLHAYEQAGVPEYWIVSPQDKLLMVFTLDAHGRYGAPTIFGKEEQAPVGVLEGLVIDLRRVFPQDEQQQTSNGTVNRL